MAEAEVRVSRRRRISVVWIVPIVALLLGVWMVVHTLRSQGPRITIVFSDAEGIEEGKTRIKLRSVEVGLVESAELGEDLKSVVVTALLDKVAEPLLREDTQFWVVRPRVGASGVSGIGTLLSGGYIQLSAGSGTEPRRHFVGLDEPPVTPAGTPGLRLRLLSDSKGSVRTGNPILYKGFAVGRVESAEFDVEADGMVFDVFIDEPYADLVNSNTRFWNISGVSLRSTAGGIQLDVASVETLLVGGITFGLPDGARPGGPVAQGEAFRLHRNVAEMNERPYRVGIQYVVRFRQSVRGLAPGAPVEFRGVPVGRVERILLHEAVDREIGTGTASPVPVLIRIEPASLGLPDREAGRTRMAEAIRLGVGNGLRASLATGSLLTGSKFVAFDYFANVEPEEVGEYAGFPTLPSVSGGLEGIQVQMAALLEKLNALPVEELLDRVDGTLASVERLLGSDALGRVPADLERTLAELRGTLASVSQDSPLQQRAQRTLSQLDATLQSLRDLLETLGQQPNALIFNREPGPDPVPPAGTP